MTRLESAMSRLDNAMARLNVAIDLGGPQATRDRTFLESELSTLRTTHLLLQDEATKIADSLDEMIGRLNDIADESEEEGG